MIKKEGLSWRFLQEHTAVAATYKSLACMHKYTESGTGWLSRYKKGMGQGKGDKYHNIHNIFTFNTDKIVKEEQSTLGWSFLPLSCQARCSHGTALTQ